MENERKALHPISSTGRHAGAAKTAEAEDRSYTGVITTPANLELTLAIVADGIGRNHLEQPVAQLAIDAILKFCQASLETNISILLSLAIDDANWRIYQEALAENRLGQMSTSLSVAAVAHHRLYVANVGNSQAYLLRARRAHRLTVEHPWMGSQASPKAGSLARPLGCAPNIRVEGLHLGGGKERAPDAYHQKGLPLQPDDAVLVCSDGLTQARPGESNGGISPQGMQSVIAAADPERAALSLVEAAAAKGADDDLTAVVIQFSGRSSRRELFPGRAGTAAALSLLTVLVLAVAIAYLIPRGLSPLPSSTPPPTPTPLPPTPLPGLADILEGQITSQGPGVAQGMALGTGESVTFGVGSTLTAMNGPATLNLPGNYQVQVSGSPDHPGVIELVQAADLSQAQPETVLRLIEGKLLVAGVGAADQRIRVTVDTLSGQATVLGTVMGVRFVPASRVVDVDCFEGQCVMQAGVAQVTLAENEHASADMRGVISAVSAILLEDYSDIQLDRFLSAEVRDRYWPPSPTEPAPPAPTDTSVPTYGGGFTWDDPFWSDFNRRSLANRAQLWPLSFLLPVLFLLAFLARKWLSFPAYRPERRRGWLSRLAAALQQLILP